MTTALPTLIGLALLIAGAEAPVRGASRLARVMGVSPLVRHPLIPFTLLIVARRELRGRSARTADHEDAHG